MSAGVPAGSLGPPAEPVDPADRIDPAASALSPPIGRVPSEVSLLNPANALTLLRLALVPVFGVLLLHGGGRSSSWRVGACAVFVLASLTDRADGALARARRQVTNFGAVADPIADKALIGTALIGLSVLQALPWAVTIVILVREVGVTVLRFAVIRHGVIPASRGGKVKTALQSLAVSLYLLPLTGPPATTRAWLMGLAVLVTLGTGLDYLGRAAALRRLARSRRA